MRSRLAALHAYASILALGFCLAGVASVFADTSGNNGLILHSTFDYGGARTASADYTTDVSLGGFGGFSEISGSIITVRLGYPGQLNEPPSAQNVVMDRPANRSLKLSISTLLANDLDLENDPMTIASVSVQSDKGANVTLDGPWISYVPPAGFTGNDTFTYTMTDGFGAAATGTITVLVTAAAGESPPGMVSLELRAVGPTGCQPLRLHLPLRPNIILECSTNLAVWQQLWTNNPLGEVVDFMDAGALIEPIRFYRTISTSVGGDFLNVSLMDVTPTGEVSLIIHQPGGLQTVLEASSNLVQWQAIMTNYVNSWTMPFIDDRTAHIPFKFYRAISTP